MPKNTYKTQKKWSLFTYLARILHLQGLFFDGLPTRYIAPILYVFVLGILYVGNTHYHEKTVRSISQLAPVVADLRVEFTTLQSSYMLESTQSAVAARVAPLGIYESKQPPCIITLEPDDF